LLLVLGRLFVFCFSKQPDQGQGSGSGFGVYPVYAKAPEIET